MAIESGLGYWSNEERNLYLQYRMDGQIARKAQDLVREKFPQAYEYALTALWRYEKLPEVREQLCLARQKLDEKVRKSPADIEYGTRGSRTQALSRQAEKLLDLRDKLLADKDAKTLDITRVSKEFRDTLAAISAEFGEEAPEKTASLLERFLKAQNADEAGSEAPPN